MAVSRVLSLLATVASMALVIQETHFAAGADMGSCYDGVGRAQRCLPEFENAAFGRRAEASHTCGRPPEDFCPHVGAPGAGLQCQRCDDADPGRRHDASYLTDFHSPDDSTWWQSPSMAFGVQYPTSVNLTLSLGKAYEITYVRLKFHTSRPESFAIYKRTYASGPWEPYQYYSASCQKTYGRPEGHYLRPGEDERVAFCTSEFSDISPLNGGNVAFSTLEGRPSAYNFEESPVLQEWVTSTDILISLDRLNTFGDDIFKDPRVLQSYYYAVSDFSVGGRCKCNGHASECEPNAAGQLACRCQHNTTGVDCERCLPFFQDRPWARGTAEDANECLPCNCSGHSEECTFDRELYRSTGHGGHCQRCRDHTTGPHCERCEKNYYRWSPKTPCQPCDCHPAGSLSLQCDNSGVCPCKPTVTGWKCDRCLPGFHSLSEGGCRPCACNVAGSLGTCDPRSGNCPCKENVEGSLCDRCRPGTFNLQPHNPVGCSSCFCYGHSKVCSPAAGFQEHHIRSDFRHGAGGWQIRSMGVSKRPLQWSQSGLLLGLRGGEELSAPKKFLGDQRLSYGQPVILTLQVPPGGSPPPIQLRLEGAGLALSLRPSSLPSPQDTRQPRRVQLQFLLQETSEEAESPLPTFHFQRLLSNLTALSIWTSGQGPGHSGQVLLCEVQLTSAWPQRELAPPASWVETCLCPQGYTGQFCEFCALGYKREIPHGGPYANCIPCTCNQLGFFGFSIKGCRDCRCSPLGAASSQCHENSTCVCRPGFVGYKCDRCQDNFFLADGDTGCQECPTCYALVKEEAAKLKARLMLMEGWLQRSDCGSPWGPLDILQGEAPLGDVYQGHHLLQETRGTFLQQMVGLEDSVKATWEQLQVLRGHVHCAQAGAQKTCIQLAELEETLQSSEEEVLRAASALSFLASLQKGSSTPTNWSHLASEAQILARSHRDTATKIEATSERALLASNASYELLKLWRGSPELGHIPHSGWVLL